MAMLVGAARRVRNLDNPGTHPGEVEPANNQPWRGCTTASTWYDPSRVVHILITPSPGLIPVLTRYRPSGPSMPGGALLRHSYLMRAVDARGGALLCHYDLMRAVDAGGDG